MPVRWHATQPVNAPLWFIFSFAHDAVPVWQLLQSCAPTMVVGIERLARCLAAVVASSAARDEHGVIDLGTEKTDGVLVASLTGCCSGYMAG